MIQTQDQYFHTSLSYGIAKEDYALEWLRSHYRYILKDIARIPYDPKDNSRNRLYGDITMLTKDDEEIRFEVKSRKSKTDDLTFEITLNDAGNPVLVEKYVHYYLIMIPDRPPILLDYLVFQQLFYDGLWECGQISKNKWDSGTVIFIPIDEFVEQYSRFMGYLN